MNPPYFTLETANLRLVFYDYGLYGDAEQTGG